MMSISSYECMHARGVFAEWLDSLARENTTI